MSKAYVLHSGGIDSTTCLYMAIEEYEPQHVKAVSITYGQRHVKEIAQAREICKLAGVPHISWNIGPQPESILTDHKAEIPDVSYADLPEGQSPTYVPFRNGQLLSKIAAIASADPEGSTVYFGSHAEDWANWAYPDCTPEFVGAMANAIYIGTYHKIRLVTPLMWLKKSEIVVLGESLSVPWHLTWSCYKGEEFHCGICPTCRSRRAGFTEAQVEDPTPYRKTT